MRRLLFFALSLLTVAQISAQNIEVVSNVINFSNTDELSTATQQIVVYNPGIYPITVEDVDVFSKYSIEPFFTIDTAFSLMPLDSATIHVDFEPNQNVNYEMALVIKTKSGFGHKPVQLNGQGTFSNNYYSSTQNLTDQALKAALKTKLAAGYNSLGYTSARDNMYSSIDNSAGTVTCVYTGRTASFTTRAGANNNNFNCEHTFPQGFFNQNEPMRSDIHHLFPTDVTSNSQRSNLPFGVVTGAGTWNQGGSKKGGGKFEPRNQQKGATARAMMYFVIRYQDYSNHFSGQETILRQWHEDFPPNSGEIGRNNAIAALQTSRNPFVDYPQLVDRIFNFTTNASRPLVKDVYVSDDTISLAKAAGRFVYDFVVYNNGTDEIELENFSLTDTNLRFDQGNPGTILLPAGDAQIIKISFNSANAYNANLLFDTDVPNKANVIIPIRSGGDIGILEKSALPTMRMYPNPATAYARVSYGKEKPLSLVVFDLSGKEFKQENTSVIDCSSLSKGIYVVKAMYKNGYVATQRLVIL